METELIKLKVKEASFTEVKSTIIKDTFIKSCKQLDASIFEPLIDEEHFEDLDKYRFLHEMQSRFDVLKSEGVKEVQLVMGKCEMCFRGAVVYEFYVQPNIGSPAFSYNIKEKDILKLEDLENGAHFFIGEFEYLFENKQFHYLYN